MTQAGTTRKRVNCPPVAVSIYEGNQRRSIANDGAEHRKRQGGECLQICQRKCIVTKKS